MGKYKLPLLSGRKSMEDGDIWDIVAGSSSLPVPTIWV